MLFTPDGHLLTAAGNTIIAWDSATPNALTTFKGHTAPVYALAVHPGGKRLASGDSDTMLKFWDLTSGHELLTIRTSEVQCALAFCANGQRLMSAGFNRVQFHDAPELTAQQEAQLIIRDLQRTCILSEDMVAAVEQRSDLSAPVRTAAFELAHAWQPSASSVNWACWVVVMNPNRTSEETQLALKRAIVLERLAANNANDMNTVAAVQYRAGDYEKCIATMQRVVDLHASQGNKAIFEDVVFLAMAHHQLDRRKEAQAYYEQLPELRRAAPAGNRDVNVLAAEAEALFGKKN
jgi:hypothetical protein